MFIKLFCFLELLLKQVRGVILQSPVLSAYRVGFNLRFTLPGDMFPNIDKAPKIRAPTYVVHGTHDEIVPIWHGCEFLFYFFQINVQVTKIIGSKFFFI